MSDQVEELKAKILKDLSPAIELNFEVIDDWLTIRPKGYLGTEAFKELRDKIYTAEIGGEYVSAEKCSHFRVALKSKGTNIREWYAKQKGTNLLPSALTLNLNLQIQTPEQLENFLIVLKKHCMPSEGGR